jgi:hypothetical protein
VCFLFLDPHNEIASSSSSSVVLCSFVLSVYTVALVLVFCLCPSPVRVVATFPGTVLFPLLYSVLQFPPPSPPNTLILFFYLVLLFPVSVSRISSVLLLNLVSLSFSIQTSHPNVNAALAVML